MYYFTRFIDQRCIEVRYGEVDEEVVSEGRWYVLAHQNFLGLTFDELRAMGEGMFTAAQFRQRRVPSLLSDNQGPPSYPPGTPPPGV